MRFALVKKNTKELKSDSSFDHFYLQGKGKGSSITHTKGFFAHVAILLLTKGTSKSLLSGVMTAGSYERQSM